jgi:hypothetical protein
MPTELPPPPPELVMQMDKLYATCSELLDRYISGFNIDLNRHAVKHGSMSETQSHYHLTKVLASQVPPNMLAGIAAAAIVRGIAGKAKGKG